MSSSSKVTSNRDEPTVVLRTGSSAQSSITMTALPARLPTLPGSPTPMPFGSPLNSVQVPGYEIIRELGRGGMGVVYLARHRRLNRLVALKMVLARQYAGPDDQLRFRQEVEAVANLNHPNIAQVYEVGEHDGFAFAAFEYVDGGTLLAWQGEKPVDPREAARLIATIARAVQHAHDHGIIHRDLKPANILLVKAECGTRLADASSPHPTLVPKVTDFGLAKKLNTESDLTVTGMACGTPNYMAPEQIRGKHAHIGPGTDVYGLGAILYELLTVKPPFRGETPLTTMQAVLDDPPPPVRKLRADVPQDLDVIVAKCLEKDPGQRYESASALADDLDRFLELRPILARGIGSLERGRRWVARNPWAAGLIASLLVGCLSILAFAVVIWRGAQNERQMRQELERSVSATQLAEQSAVSKQKDAEQAHTVAAKNAAQAQDAQKAAEASAAQAAMLLTIATESIDTVLAKFAADPSFHDADYLDLRINLLLKAMDLYQQMEGQMRKPVIVHRYARACYFYGLLMRTTGQIEIGNGKIDSAIAVFASLLKEHPGESAWHIEYARMLLEELDRAEQDGRMYRISIPRFLKQVKRSLDTVETAQGTLKPADAAAYRLLATKWKAQSAILNLSLKPAEHYEMARAVLPEAEAVLKAQPEEPDAVDLYGNLLLQVAKLAARAGSVDAAGYFDAADAHYLKAKDVWFKSDRVTRWHCKYALSRQAHGTYYDSRGEDAKCDDAYVEARKILETAVITTPEVRPYCIEIAEAYLEILKRMRRLSPTKNPFPMVDLLDGRLAPFWNIGMPTDRARRVLCESKMVLAQWQESQNLPIDAANTYTRVAAFWLYRFKDGEGGFYRHYAQENLVRAARLYATNDQRKYALNRLEQIAKEKEVPEGVWFDVATTWCVLADDGADTVSDDLAEALHALQKADDAGFFRVPANRELYRNAPEFAVIREQFEPKNTAARDN